MKKLLLVLIPVGVLLLVFICLSVFFAVRGVYAAQVTDSYFLVYRDRAVDYAKASPDLLAKYGDYTVRPDSSVSYRYTEEEGDLHGCFLMSLTPGSPPTSRNLIHASR